ncbi:hypothetical protein PYCCODRAFT_1436723 [Trametes coccinea BRFM310]|uniref:Uncharacterized protein n=1 Tax=Trametes coccinea (strain BRFM310) TaxID=1353009 RepID=A0A1Y2IJ91_TRAC3|nr:hypothetical protein PYCCODRAFT_1436723 [Trametes coccinea BRFM310]
MRLLAATVALCILQAAHTVLANTEIVNFDASPIPNLSLPEALDWPIIEPSNSQLMLQMQPAPVDTPITTLCEPVLGQAIGECDHEAWLRLDLDTPSWSSCSKFTFRISWPANYPTDFYIDIHSPESLAAVLHGAVHSNKQQSSESAFTRRRFARIRVVHAGVFTPSSMNRTIEAVPFVVTVEPLYFDVLPASLVPTVLLLLGVVVVTGFVAYPRINRYLFVVAEQVNREIAGARAPKEE